ncbi:putative membrane protein YphA (DoxX/SURF4 family) [Chitinophaga terrae (ex Kim and Jung 2007)]|uniref:DoxX family protein n=1 Tax=Chitinophaga terrae (ex Kim and Jung 2007) TaxID=408074 RepID=UPI00277DBD3E|nr:DoxX family protein [Chitinophaga terrae (ex Kim and Jung 2007)]MDQ0107363.1 putative membrane protein YphA (DoxX/SURF4 family) [Chitinophaga terrae (ex Kim and Jung 2007)]
MSGKQIFNIFLWVLQGLLAVLFLSAGAMKLFQPVAQQAAMYPWTGEVPRLLLTIMGLVDLLGGIGIILPAILKIKPWLTVWAAAGIVLLMLSAIVFHISRHEAQVTGFNIAVALLAGIVAWGRRKRPLQS